MAIKSPGPARPKKSENITVALDEGTKIAVRKIAAQHDVSVSRVFRDALHEYLERHKIKAA